MPDPVKTRTPKRPHREDLTAADLLFLSQVPPAGMPPGTAVVSQPHNVPLSRHEMAAAASAPMEMPAQIVRNMPGPPPPAPRPVGPVAMDPAPMRATPAPGTPALSEDEMAGMVRVDYGADPRLEMLRRVVRQTPAYQVIERLFGGR